MEHEPRDGAVEGEAPAPGGEQHGSVVRLASAAKRIQPKTSGSVIAKLASVPSESSRCATQRRRERRAMKRCAPRSRAGDASSVASRRGDRERVGERAGVEADGGRRQKALARQVAPTAATTVAPR